MRKGIADKQAATTMLSINALKNLENNGYKYVQVKALTLDRHYDYIEPHCLVLVPIKELPKDALKKDIYEPVNSELLKQWASQKDDGAEVLISNFK